MKVLVLGAGVIGTACADDCCGGNRKSAMPEAAMKAAAITGKAAAAESGLLVFSLPRDQTTLERYALAATADALHLAIDGLVFFIDCCIATRLWSRRVDTAGSRSTSAGRDPGSIVGRRTRRCAGAC
jgi:hypothetical protein